MIYNSSRHLGDGYSTAMRYPTFLNIVKMRSEYIVAKRYVVDICLNGREYIRFWRHRIQDQNGNFSQSIHYVHNQQHELIIWQNCICQNITDGKSL